MKRIIVKGAPGFPYTRKMLSLLRYRRLVYNCLIGGIFEDEDKKFIKNFLYETGCELLFDGK